MKRRHVAADQLPDTTEAIAGRSAADRIQAVVVLAAPYAQGAAGRVIPIARAAGGRAVPLVQSAAQQIGPMSRSAAQRVSPYGKQAAVLLVPYAQLAAGRVVPLAQTARQRGSQVAQEAATVMGPRLDNAFLRLNPVMVEVTKRGKATLAAAKGELFLPEVAPKKTRVWPARLAVFAGAAGVGVLVAKKLMPAKDADWTEATGGETSGPEPTSGSSVDDIVETAPDQAPTVHTSADASAELLDAPTPAEEVADEATDSRDTTP